MFYNKYKFIIKKPPPLIRQNGYSDLKLINKSKNKYKKIIIIVCPVILLVICSNIYHKIHYIY